MNIKRSGGFAAVALVGALALSACAANEGTPGGTPTGETLSGSIAGSGASSQAKAEETWIAKFTTANSGVEIAYEGGGSGAGRTAFLAGGVDFAGSDRAFKVDEITTGLDAANTRAADDATFIELPLYISPIAVGYNLPDVTELNLDASTIAKIFSGKITKWNDAAIAALNPDATLPDLAITPIHRSTNSGTTENFVDYLSKAAPSDWTYAVSGDWPKEITGGEGAAETGDVAAALQNEGTIGYLDASRAPGETAKIKVGDAFVGYTAEGAAAVVDASPAETGRTEGDIAIALDRTTTAAGAYPLVLVSYLVAYSHYADPKQAALVKAYFSYIASEQGQADAAGAAGSAPISDALRAKIVAAIELIK